jgi:hypothetical protein
MRESGRYLQHKCRKPVACGRWVTTATETSHAASHETIKVGIRIPHRCIWWTEWSIIGSLAKRFWGKARPELVQRVMDRGTVDPEKGCEKDRQCWRQVRNERIKHFQGKSGEEGAWNCKEGRCMARTPRLCSAISCLSGGIYRPARFFNVTCEWLWCACTLYPTCRRHVVYCTYCVGASVESVLTNLRHGTRVRRGGPWYTYIHAYTWNTYKYIHTYIYELTYKYIQISTHTCR